MKRTLTIFVIIIMVLTVFMSSALADKPADKPQKGDDEQGEETQGEEPDGEEDAKKPNEKRDAKLLFREETRPLIDEVHANREEWGALGEDQEGLDFAIDAQIGALLDGGLELPPETIALIKEKVAQMKDLKVQMRGLKGDIHVLWKQYIAAKKESDVASATAALNELIAIQEARIGIRSQIVAIMNELAAALDYTPEPAPEAVVPEA